MNTKKPLKLLSDIHGREKLLLHICCAPDASYGAPALGEFFDVCGYFFNPNIQPIEEHEKRLQGACELAEKLGFPLIAENGAKDEWEKAVRGLEDEPERGRRCEICIRLRLMETAKKAAGLGIPVFGTVLTVSPKKDASMINRIGADVEKTTGVRFLAADLKKRDGYLKSVRACKELGVYRQQYCGCGFSIKANKTT